MPPGSRREVTFPYPWSIVVWAINPGDPVVPIPWLATVPALAPAVVRIILRITQHYPGVLPLRWPFAEVLHHEPGEVGKIVGRPADFRDVWQPAPWCGLDVDEVCLVGHRGKHHPIESFSAQLPVPAGISFWFEGNGYPVLKILRYLDHSVAYVGSLVSVGCRGVGIQAVILVPHRGKEIEAHSHECPTPRPLGSSLLIVQRLPGKSPPVGSGDMF